MSTPLPSGGRVDTSHIRSPRDPMTPEEREAVRAELREASEAIWRVEAEHGSVQSELHALYGDPLADPPGDHDEAHAA